MPVTRWLVEPDAVESSEAGTAGEPIIGTLVHRLFQFLDGSTESSEDELAEARALLAPAERAPIVDVDAIVQAAVDLWRKMRLREDVAALLATGQRLYEVPFSMRLPRPATAVTAAQPEDVVLRGTIDCLVVRPDGSVVVVEFKTGRPRGAHQQQLDIYVDAARLLFPEASVSGQLIYG